MNGDTPGGGIGTGTVLEAAFVDPAYDWPPADGQGKNAIELQASTALIHAADETAEDDDDVSLTPSLYSTDDETYEERNAAVTLNGDGNAEKAKTKTMVVTTVETTSSSRCGIFHCCKSTDEQVVATERKTLPPEESEVERVKQLKAARLAASQERRAVRQKRIEKKKKKKRRERKQREKYKRIPEGILIYRLDTSDRTVSLMSGPSSNTDVDSLLRTMVVTSAQPARSDKTRRGIDLIGVDGTQATLVACEQRTAVAWLEAMDMMLGNAKRGERAALAAAAAVGGVGAVGAAAGGSKKLLAKKSSSQAWGKEDLNEAERDKIEEQYVNLAAYSNNLIRAGAIPGAKASAQDDKDAKSGKHRGGAGGIYYSVTTQRDESDPTDDYDEEALESIAKRRAVIKDSWDFYRMICSLLRDKRKYDEVFRRMKLDPVYPYLNSMTGLNDPGDMGYENVDKAVVQNDLEEYGEMTPTEVCKDLVQRAEEALPSLVEICKALAGSLGMEEVGVGPIKEVSSALRKAEKKYEGDILKVTDYCRALLVVKDFPTLLALLELARDSFGPLIRRVKLSTLKSDHAAMPGGYRDCKINLELKEHICEIQVHLWPMWVVCGVDGFRHYRHCLEYSTDTFGDPYDALTGLDRKTMAELIVMAEEAVADMPLESLEWYHEKYILDYFAECGLFLRHDLSVWAETTLRQLIRLRCESPDIGPDHHETLHLHKYLQQSLRAQGKNKEADEVKDKIAAFEEGKATEKTEAEQSLWESIFVEPFESMIDPNKKEREQEDRLKKEVKASKKAWRKIREQRFRFLDADAGHQDVEPQQDYTLPQR